jgi:hypothetical protein
MTRSSFSHKKKYLFVEKTQKPKKTDPPLPSRKKRVKNQKVSPFVLFPCFSLLCSSFSLPRVVAKKPEKKREGRQKR